MRIMGIFPGDSRIFQWVLTVCTEHPLKYLPYLPRISAQQRREELNEHLWPHTLAAEMGKDLPKARVVKKKEEKKFF